MFLKNLYFTRNVIVFILIFSLLGITQRYTPDERLLGEVDSSDKPALKNNSENLQRVGAWPYGPAQAVAVDEQRKLIFLGSGGVVLILNGSDPTNPQLISENLHTTGLINDICYDSTNQRLFLAAGEGGLEIWDVQDPLQPVHLSTFEVLYFGYETPVENVGVCGDYAIVECSWGYVHSIDVSDPSNPVQISFNGTMGNPARDLHVSPDGQAHTTGAQRYVRLAIQPNGILNTSGSRDFDYGPYAVFGTAQYAYVGYSGFLFILPLPNAAGQPLSVTNMNGISDIVVENSRAYIINGSGFYLYDVSNPYNPLYVGSFITNLAAYKLAISEGFAYIADGSTGLRIIDIGDGTAPVQVGTYDVVNRTGNVDISGSYAYMGHYDDGLLVLDISNLSNPVLIGQNDTPGYANDAKVQGNYVYLADYTGGFRIFDISVPGNPIEVGVLDTVNAWKVTVSGNYAYVIEAIPNNPYLFYIIDISNPASPIVLSNLTMPGTIWEVAISGNYIYVACGDNGLRVVDITNPNSPAEVGFFDAPDVFDVCIVDTLAYLASADWDGGFLILNISDPTNPTLVSLYNPFGWFHPFDVSVSGNYAYVGEPAGAETLYLFDISDPANPIELETHNFAGDLFDIYAQDSLVYISDGAAGLLILENQLYSVPAGSVNWQQQTSGTINTLQSIFFADETIGWTVGETGTILKTENGGTNWQAMTSGTSADLSSLSFADTTTGWVIGDMGTILKTTDGGTSWFTQPSGTSDFLSSVHFVNTTTGWVVGDNGIILKTIDGGNSWQSQISGTFYGLTSVDFVDINHGWITVAGFGMILKTTNGGNSWENVSVGSGSVLFSLDFIDINIGWAVGMFGTILKTTDGGNTWFEQTGVYPPDWLYSVHFLDENVGWTVGFDGKIMNTIDGGSNWTAQTSGTPYQLNSVYFVNELTGWTVGENGTILKTIPTITSIEDESDIKENITDEFILYNNYPNPFNSQTVIEFELSKTGAVTLKIYNILGEEVAILVSDKLAAGKYKYDWDATGLASGVYLYRLQTENGFTQTKKLFLLR